MKNVYFRTKVLSFIAILGIIMLSSPSISAQFFFKEYRPIPTEDQNDGRCIINIGGTLNYPNQYLSVGAYSDSSQQKIKAHAKWLYWGGFLNDTRNYERPDDEDLMYERIVKEQVNVSATIIPNPDGSQTINYIRGYPAVGTRTIKQGFPYTIADQDTWVSVLDRDNRTILFEDFISGTEGEFCVGKGIVADALDPYNAFYVLMQVIATNGRKYFAIAHYFWNGTTFSINRGWRKIYTHARDNAYDIDIAGITQKDGINGELVVAGTYRHRAGTLPSRIFMAEINKTSGAYITAAALNASQYVSWGTGGSFYPLMEGIQINSITANDFDDGYTLAGKAMQDLSNWNLPGQYTLPMIYASNRDFSASPFGTGFSYKVFLTSSDVTNDNFLHGEFFYAKQHHHWRLGSPSSYADTSFTAVGTSYYPDIPLEQYATMANSNLFPQNYYQGSGLNRWFTMHNTDFSQSYSTPLMSSAQWYDQDDSYIGAFVYTGRQMQPSGATRAIAAGIQKWDGLSNCSESPYQVDTMIIRITMSFEVESPASNWGYAAIEETDSTRPDLQTHYCSEGYIIEDGDYPKTAEEIMHEQSDILMNQPIVQYSSSQIQLSVDVPTDCSAEIFLTDIMGRNIVHERFDIGKGVHHYMYGTENLLSGNYFLSINILNKRYTYPLSIIK